MNFSAAQRLHRSTFLFVVFALLFSGFLSAGRTQDKPFDPFAVDAPQFLEAEPAEVELISEVDAIVPGKPFTVMLKIRHPEKWHSYYVNPGTVGKILEPNWSLPEGFQVERVAWPLPHIAMTGGLNTYGYEDTVRHLFTVTAPATLEEGKTVALSADPAWQICNEFSCADAPEQPATLTLQLAVADQAKVNADAAADFSTARSSLPKSLPADLQVSATLEAGLVSLLLSPSASVPEGKLHFYDDDGQLDSQAEATIDRTEEGVRWTTGLSEKEVEDKGKHLSGILAIGDQGYAVDLEVKRAPAKPVEFGALIKILGGMFVGGMILNLMPCVFPVIGLKIMGFVQQAGEDRKKIALHGVLFAVGVLVSFWVLSGILLGVREGVLGSGAGEVSWGYQLQNPWMVWGLMLIMFLLALNMYGVFEIGTSATGVGGSLAQKQGAVGTFFSGVLATVVATPCSAPFLGAALGATVGLPAVSFMLSFTAMALGLAFPYLLLSLFPQLIEKLPRPGPWMESFKQGMSFLLFATAGYLLWIYTVQIKVDAMLNVVIGLTAIAVAVWIYGRWCTIGKSKRARTIGTVMLLLFAVFGVKASMPGHKSMDWKEWSQAAVEEALQDGRPVYVDFTAAWCATCQQNKKLGYNEDVQLLLKQGNVLLLKADKTNPVPEIDAAIRQLGREAIPVNVLYVPGEETPQITQPLFTSSYMIDFLSEHLPESDEVAAE